MDIAAARAEYRDRFRDASASLLHELVWARVRDGDGPAVNAARGEDRGALLAWVLGQLPREEAGRLATAAVEVLHDVITTPPADEPTVAAAVEVCHVLELARGVAEPNPASVRRAFAALVTDAGPTAAATALDARETPAGDRLLSNVLRALALHTPADLKAGWRRLVAADGLEGARLPAFLGYCRAAGEKARDALPFVAEALAARGRPGLLAVALKSFATAGYADAPCARPPDDLTARDFAALFGRVPDDQRAAFRERTLDALGKLAFAPQLPDWAAAARAADTPAGWFADLAAGAAEPAEGVFRKLVREVGHDARVALPLVARAASAAADGVARLAAVLRWLYQLTDADLAREGRVRAWARYMRKPLDDGDFTTLFALVPPADRAAFRAATFTHLRAEAWAAAADLARWEAKAAAPLHGVLGDAIDSPVFARYPVIHLLLAPALKAADPDAFGRLRGVFVQSDPIRPLGPPSVLWVRPDAFAPADLFLYAPATPELRALRAEARAAAAGVPYRYVTSTGGDPAALAPKPADVLPRRLSEREEAAVLDVFLGDLTQHPTRAAQIVAEVLVPFAGPVPVGADAPAAAGAVTVTVRTAPAPAGASAADKHLAEVRPRSAARPGRAYVAESVAAADRPGLLASLKAVLPVVVGFVGSLSGVVVTRPRADEWRVQLAPVPD